MKHKKTKGKNSLVGVTKNFVLYMEKFKGKEVEMVQIERNHIGSKRRLYDVINVLSGINYIERSARAKIKWIGLENAENQSFLEKKVESLPENELDRLDAVINQKLEEITNSPEFMQYGFITNEDVLSLSNNHLYVLNNPPDLSIKVKKYDDESIKIFCHSENGIVDLQKI